MQIMKSIRYALPLILLSLSATAAESADSLLDTITNRLIEISPQEKRIQTLKAKMAEGKKEMDEKLLHSQNRDRPLLSFTIPCYNRASVVREAIDSIYIQKLDFPFEVIAVDDGSTDGSFEVLEEYEQRHGNFFAFRNPKNLGAPETRNIAISHARGDYICNADSDDIFIPDSIAPMFEAMRARGYEIAYFETMIFTDHLKQAPDTYAYTRPPNHEIRLEPFLGGYEAMSTNSGNVIFSKSCWLQSGGYVEEPGHDTWTFSCKVLANGYIGYVHPGSAYRHRQWGNAANKYHEDNKNLVTGFCPRAAIVESMDLLTGAVKTEPSNDYLDVLTWDIRNRRIQMVSHYKQLLNAYSLENKESYQEALQQYLALLRAHPYLSERIYLRAARVACYLNRLDIARSILSSRPNS